MRYNKYLPGLLDHGMDIAVVAGTPSYKKLTEGDRRGEWEHLPMGSFLPPEKIGESNIYRVRIPDKQGLSRIRTLDKAVVQFIDDKSFQPDVLHMLSSKPHISLPMLNTLRSRGVGLVYSYAIAHKYPKFPLGKQLKEHYLRKTFNRFDRIVLASDELKGLLLGIGVKSHIEVIPNGVNTTVFSPARDSEEKRLIRRELGLPETAFLIIGVGPVYPRKGPDLLLKAWHKLKDRYKNLHVVWVGRRRDLFDPVLAEYKKTMDPLLEGNDAENRIHMVGHTPHIDKYLKASDMLVFPTEREGMPNAVLEAFATGLPTVMTHFKGHSMILGKPGREYEYVDRSVESITLAIQNLLDNPQRLEEIGKNARKHISETMPLSKSIDRHAEMYEKLAWEKREKRP